MTEPSDEQIEAWLTHHCPRLHIVILPAEKDEVFAFARRVWREARVAPEARYEHWFREATKARGERDALRRRLATLESALREISHAATYDGSLCPDMEDCPNCVAQAALRSEEK